MHGGGWIFVRARAYAHSRRFINISQKVSVGMNPLLEIIEIYMYMVCSMRLFYLWKGRKSEKKLFRFVINCF